MTVKVVNRENEKLQNIYENVITAADVFDENGNYCHQLRMNNGETATYPANEWTFYKIDWCKMF